MFFRSFPPALSKGQSFIEVIVALAIGIVVILSLVSITSVSVNNSQFARNQDQAVKLAQQAMEWIRTQRDDLTWAEFSGKVVSGSTIYCLNTLDWVNGNCSNYITSTIFKRTAVLSTNAADCSGAENIEVEVDVSWQDSKGTHHSLQKSCFSNWQKK